MHSTRKFTVVDKVLNYLMRIDRFGQYVMVVNRMPQYTAEMNETFLYSRS